MASKSRSAKGYILLALLLVYVIPYVIMTVRGTYISSFTNVHATDMTWVPAGFIRKSDDAEVYRPTIWYYLFFPCYALDTMTWHRDYSLVKQAIR